MNHSILAEIHLPNIFLIEAVRRTLASAEMYAKPVQWRCSPKAYADYWRPLGLVADDVDSGEIKLTTIGGVPVKIDALMSPDDVLLLEGSYNLEQE